MVTEPAQLLHFEVMVKKGVVDYIDVYDGDDVE